MKTPAEVGDAFLRELRAAPLVKLANDYFEFYLDGEMVYDFQATDAGHALRWAEHMAQKSWVTKQHLEQFVRLAAGKFGAEYR